MTKNQAIKSILLQNYEKTKKAINLVLETVAYIESLDPTKTYNSKELEPYDALLSRYERSIELVTTKLFRTIQIYEIGKKESAEGTLRDRLNLMTKLKLIDDTDLWMSMRDFKITHDYLPEKLINFYDIIKSEYSKVLEEFLLKSEKYVNEKILG